MSQKASRYFFILGLIIAILISSQGFAQTLNGNVDGISFVGTRTDNSVWACALATAPIHVTVYHSATPPSTAAVKVAGPILANLTSEAGVKTACHSTLNHRFG